MLKNYLILAFRNLWRNKTFSFINVVGLSIGMAVCISILLFVSFEKSFDATHTKNIYRLNEVQSPEGMASSQKVALSMYPMAPTLMDEFPEIKNYVRLNHFEMAGLANKNKKVFLDNVFWTDPSFFQVFDYKLLKGDPKTALKAPNSVVLTTESAIKLFGHEDALGKSLTTHNMSDTLHFTVTGIMENIPQNSHLQFNALYSLITKVNPTDTNNWRSGWGGNWLITYLELAHNSNIERLEKKFPAYLQKHMGDDIIKSYQLFLQPLKEVHSTSGDITHDYFNFKKFDKSYTTIFLLIGLIVLVIASVNFINLSTAKSGSRAKEVGVRKSIGAQRSQLTFQFLTESILLSFIAMLIALLLVKISLPFVNQLSDHQLEFSFIKQPLLLLKILSATLLLGLLAGLYPALYLSSFKPVKVLKGISLSGKSLSRNALVTGQFACAAFLIITTIFVLQQLNFMRNKDAGFNKDQVIIISGAYKGYARLKAALEQSPLVKGVTGSSQSLGNNLHQGGFTFKGNGPERELASSHVLVDEDFISLYQIKLLAGKNFSKEGNGNEYIINESLAKELLKDTPKAPLESLIGKILWGDDDTTSTIVGISADFNFNTLHNKVETLALINLSTYGFHDVSVKIDGSRAKEAIAEVEAIYKNTIHSYPFSYVFLDEHFEKLYRNDQKVSKVVAILGILAIVIACLGLLGLASYATQSRVKEIGVRKVLGASVPAIIQLLSFDFIKPVLIANLIAWPVAWLAMNSWLQNYAYHISISLWVFVVAGVCSLLIALISVSSHTFKAAIANPVKSLRTE